MDFGGETTIGIVAIATINRADFGMTWNVPMDDGGPMVGLEVEIELNIEAYLEEEAALRREEWDGVRLIV